MASRVSRFSGLFLVFALLARSNGADAGKEPPTGEEILRKSSRGIRFSRACERGTSISLSAVGDVLLHDLPQIQATREPERFQSLWSRVSDLLRRADLTYANLEGPVSWGINRRMEEVPDPGFVFEDDVYSGLPFVNYHRYLLDDLMASGVDVVSTANNHALDRGALGLERTIEALRSAGLAFMGTRARSDRSPRWYAITEAKGIRVAWVACTYQNARTPDPEGLTMQCYKKPERVEEVIMTLLRERKADAVIVTAHWGQQFEFVPEKRQIVHARRFLEAGALAVIGAHPHVVQPWEKIITRDGRETFVIYSLGNFVSGHRQLPRRATLLLNLGLTKTRFGKTALNGVRYTPLLMTRDRGYLALQAIDRLSGRDRHPDADDAWQLVVDMFGRRNLMTSDDPLVTNPECDDSG